MNLFKGKSAPKEEQPTYVIVFRGRDVEGFDELVTREQAMQIFDGCLETSHINGAGRRQYALTPFNGRRLFITGPDYCVQPDDPTDPLLVGAAGLRAVLSDAEYAAFVQAPVAAALLES